jgi:hypothetical protein
MSFIIYLKRELDASNPLRYTPKIYTAIYKIVVFSQILVRKVFAFNYVYSIPLKELPQFLELL